MLGLTVVTAAGNDGETAYNFPAYGSIASPGTAPDAITVGATYNAHVFYASVGVTDNPKPTSLQGLAAFFGDSPKPGGPFTAPMSDVSTIGGTQNPDACLALPSGSLNGTIALILTDPNCNYSTQAINAENAGASAALFYLPSGFENIYVIEGLGEVGIPVVMIGNTDGTNLSVYLASNPGATVTINPAITENRKRPRTSSLPSPAADRRSKPRPSNPNSPPPAPTFTPRPKATTPTAISTIPPATPSSKAPASPLRSSPAPPPLCSRPTPA